MWWLQVLICRNYMGDMDMNEIDHFMPILMKREEEAEMTPLVSHGPSHFLWIKHSNLYRIHVYIYITHLYEILLILKSLLWLWMCVVGTTLGGLACSVSCASSRFTLGSHITAAGSSSDSVPQPVERMRTTLVWSVRHTCTLLIQRHIAVPQITDLYLFYFSLPLQFALFWLYTPSSHILLNFTTLATRSNLWFISTQPPMLFLNIPVTSGGHDQEECQCCPGVLLPL